MTYTHVVISGGGLYGVCMLGVFRYLYIEKKLVDVKNIAGNSMGAFFSLAYCLKIDILELENIIKELSSNCSLLITKNNFSNIFFKNGILSFTVYTNRLKQYLNEKYTINDLTFIELTKKFGINLYVSATNLNKCENIIFSTDNTPNVSIFDATAASMSIPYFSKPVIIDGEYYLDGLFTNNFPINIFKNIQKHNILGIVIKISSEYNIKTYKKNTKFNFIEYNKRILELLYLNTSKVAFFDLIDNNNNNLLIIQDSPITNYLLINIKKNCIKSDCNNVHIDNLILDGYIKAHNFFNDIKS
jgi:predicted acylesterase/phospholipase RssA